MTGLPLGLALLALVLVQDGGSRSEPLIAADAQSPASRTSETQTPLRPAASSSVRTISANTAPRPGTPTRTVCGWEGTTGSTMKRRVCREVTSNSQTELDNREMLRNLQRARVEPIN